MRERKGCKKRQENKRKKSFLEPKLSKIGFVNITAFPIPSQDPVPSPL